MSAPTPQPSGPQPYDIPLPDMPRPDDGCRLCGTELWRPISVMTETCMECRWGIRNGSIDAILWLPVVGYETRYQVSSEGEVRSTRSRRRLSIDHSGRYARVTLDGRRFYAHDIVMAAFVGPKPLGQMVLHRNDDGHDPRLANLSFGDHSENHADYRRNQTTGTAPVEREPHE